MGGKFKSFFHVVMGAIGGMFIGGTLGEILGAGTGAIVALMELGELRGSQLIATSGFLGTVFASILGGGLLSLGRVISGTRENLDPRTLICAVIGLAAGSLYGTLPAGRITSTEFMIFAGSVGVWAGIATGSSVGVQMVLIARKNRAAFTDEEKNSNANYADFLKQKARRK